MSESLLQNEISELADRIAEDAKAIRDQESNSPRSLTKGDIRRRLLSINISVHEIHELVSRLP